MRGRVASHFVYKSEIDLLLITMNLVLLQLVVSDSFSGKKDCDWSCKVSMIAMISIVTLSPCNLNIFYSSKYFRKDWLSMLVE